MFVCIYICAPCVCGAGGNQKRALDTPKLELQMSCGFWDPLQEQHVSLAAEPSLQAPGAVPTAGWDWQTFMVTVLGDFCGFLRNTPRACYHFSAGLLCSFTRPQVFPCKAGCLQTSCSLQPCSGLTFHCAAAYPRVIHILHRIHMCSESQG